MRETLQESAVQADHTSLAEAAEWYAVLMEHADQGRARWSEDTRQRWQQWLAQRPQNPLAWAHIESVSQRFAPLREAPGDAVVDGLRGLRAKDRRRRQVLRGLATFGLGGLGGWLAWQHPGVRRQVWAWASDEHTAVGELRRVTLPDGSDLWLNTATAVDVDFSDEERMLRLRSGELLVQTSAAGPQTAPGQPQAPSLFVQTRHGRLQALGTRFLVRLDSVQSALTVYEGAVQITTAQGRSQRVAAGERTVFDDRSIAAIAPAVAADQAWVHGSIVADNITLGELAAQLARYRQAHIAVAPEVASLRVMGVYPARDPARALAMLAQALPIRVRRPLPWWVTIEAR